MNAPTSLQPTAAFEQVQLADAGLITLASLDQLEQSHKEASGLAVSLRNQAAEAQAQAEDRLADIGAALVPAKSNWTVPAELTPAVEDAGREVDRIRSLDAQISALGNDRPSGLSGLVSRVTRWGQSRELIQKRADESQKLRQLLIVIGQKAGPIVRDSFPTAAPLLEQVAQFESNAAAKTTLASDADQKATELASEIRRRRESQREMGFDALYTAAYLHAHGAPSVQSPLDLKHGELAAFVASATLARMQTRTRYVGGSSGFSIPIGHTGIRYRIGSYHGRPIQQQTLTRLDAGSLVVTNQRVAFVGRTKSVSVPLSKVIHVDLYSDAVAVFHEGKENADYFLLSAPKQALFYINWAIGSG